MNLIHDSYLGAAKVQVSYEYERASGDGWNEPRHEEQVTVAAALINDAWCDVEDVATPATIQRWEEEIWASRADEANAAAESAAEARAEMRRDWALEDREVVWL